MADEREYYETALRQMELLKGHLRLIRALLPNDDRPSVRALRVCFPMIELTEELIETERRDWT